MAMLHSIRWRLVASYVLLTLITVVALGSVALWATRRFASQQEISYLRSNAEAIARQALPFMGARPTTSALYQLARLASFFGDARVRILDENMQPLADSGGAAKAEEFAWFILPSGRPGFDSGDGWVFGLIPRSEPVNRLDLKNLTLPLLELLPDGTEITIITRSAEPWGSLFQFGEDVILTDPNLAVEQKSPQRAAQVFTHSIQDGDRLVGFVELSSERDFSSSTLATARRGIILAGTFAVIVAGVIGLWMGGRLSKPILQLTDNSRQMSSGNLSVRAKVESRDEIGELAAQFNQMAGQLQASFDQLSAERDTLRRFISDASHELRTPITALKNFNALLIQGADQDPKIRAEFLGESRQQIERLEWITRNLLDLSRLDAGLVPFEISEHEGPGIVQAVLTTFKPLADQLGIELTTPHLVPGQAATVRCDRARMEIALSNLLDNALKYSPPGSQVKAGFDQTNEGSQFWVEDQGDGIPAEDLPHIFERFYRGSNHRSTGSGLGLAIVQSIAQAHQGSVRAENLPGKGARFTITLPYQS
jgi:signal transduction histidine kinase